MTSLPETLVQFRAELEQAIGREQAARLRQSKRRRRVAVAVAAVVVVGTASAFASVRNFFVDPSQPRGRVSRTVDGVRFSLFVPRTSWQNGPIVRIGGKLHARSLYISKSTVPPQEAEAVIFWTVFPHGGEAAPCAKQLSPVVGRSTADLAAVVASAPGTRVVMKPSRVTLGGRPAMYVVLTVRKDLGCDPGFFFTWRFLPLGPVWVGTEVGDTIRVWIVDVDGKSLFIEAETGKRAGRDLAQEITKIVGSIRFD